jgi:hypothetical protein
MNSLPVCGLPSCREDDRGRDLSARGHPHSLRAPQGSSSVITRRVVTKSAHPVDRGSDRYSSPMGQWWCGKACGQTDE